MAAMAILRLVLALLLLPAAAWAEEAKAIFAGGSFWSMEQPFDAIAGVRSTTLGYLGGTKADPTYEEVYAGGTGYVFAVEVAYDPAKVTYERLLDVFWHNVDPTTRDRQFCDVGPQYRSAIFTLDAEQQRLAEASRDKLERSLKLRAAVVTEIAPAGRFWPAEDVHQDFYRKNGFGYRLDRATCGRDHRLEELWGPKR